MLKKQEKCEGRFEIKLTQGDYLNLMLTLFIGMNVTHTCAGYGKFFLDERFERGTSAGDIISILIIWLTCCYMVFASLASFHDFDQSDAWKDDLFVIKLFKGWFLKTTFHKAMRWMHIGIALSLAAAVSANYLTDIIGMIAAYIAAIIGGVTCFAIISWSIGFICISLKHGIEVTFLCICDYSNIEHYFKRQ